MRHASVFALLIVLVTGSACSKFQRVADVSSLKQDQRVIVGEVTLVDGDLSDWMTGLYTGASLVFDYEDPMEKGRPRVNVYSGENLIGGGDRPRAFRSTGGIFNTGVDSGRPAYLLGIRVTSTLVLVNVTRLVPLLVKIPRGRGKCQYVGSIVLTRIEDKDRGEVEVEDNFERDKEKYERVVKGCVLTKNIASTQLDPEE